MRLTDAYNLLLPRLRALWPAVAPTWALASVLRGEAEGHVTEPEFARALAQLEVYAREGAAWPAYGVARPPPADHGYPTDEEIAWGDAELSYLDDLAQRVELTLCVVRTGLCQAALARPAWAEGPWRADLAAMRAAHLEHRRADRDARVAALKNAIAAGAGPYTMPKLVAALAAVEACSDETLLVDRGCTAG